MKRWSPMSYKHFTGTIIFYRPGYFAVHSPAPTGPKFSNSENCYRSEIAMPPKFFWDMEGSEGCFCPPPLHIKKWYGMVW